jgi:hypothetical protein
VTRVDAVIPTEKEECLICREVLYNISCNDDDDDDDDDREALMNAILP